MDESKKSSQFFSDFEKSILRESVMDIGAGKDPIVAHADVFDLAQGDANHITRYISRRYDCVYSSHCLEHMRDPSAALLEWWELVKPGGWLFFFVPDEDLYEQGVFPSRFNNDHKFTFTLAKKRSWSPVSVNVFELIRGLPKAEIVSIALNDIGYDRQLMTHGPFKPAPFTAFCIRWMKKFERRGIRLWPRKFEHFMNGFMLRDQTTGHALAQIEVVLRKNVT